MLIRESFDAYHARRRTHLTSHSLAVFRRCPRLFARREAGLAPDEIESSAYLVGRAAHTLILEGRDQYEREYAVGGPINPKTGQPFGSQTKAFAEWAAEQRRPVLSDSHAALVEQMAAAVAEHGEAQNILRGGVREGVARTTRVSMNLQARIDFYCPDHKILADLKTCATLDGFEESCEKFDYLHQLSYYRMIVDAIGLYATTCYIIAVEKQEPFRCGVWEIGSACLDRYAAENDRAMEELIECRKTGHWPTRFEKIRKLEY